MHSKRLVYDKFKREDFDHYYALVGNVEVMRWITGHARSLEESKRIFEYVLQTNRESVETGYFAISQSQDNRFIGLGKIIMQNHKKAEIGYALLPASWGKGYGSEISQTLVEYASAISYIKEIVAIIDPENRASKKILLKCGLELEETCTIDNLPAEVYKLKKTFSINS